MVPWCVIESFFSPNDLTLLGNNSYPFRQVFVSCGLFVCLGDDSLHFKSGQSEADDEHAEGKIEKHSVRGISRF